jgi:ornithine cyclodeaminase/alanine dehydrogenase
MRPLETLLFKRAEVGALLSLDECITAVEQAFSLYAEGQTLLPGVLSVHAHDGGFHIKAAGLKLARKYFAAKVNGNFFRNTERYGMPNIQGIIILCDGENGYPLALMDSIEITILRTGAATAVAAKYLARDDAKVATICGCGNQGRIQLKALMKVCSLERVYAFDLDHNRAEQFAGDLSDELGIEAQAVHHLGSAVQQSDVCVTCTPSRQFFLKREDVAPGTFIAAVGADDERKQELDPHLFVGQKIVVDLLEQCTAIGDLHHALDQGLITGADVHAELGEVIMGKKSGRTSRDEIIIFDSTGTALQDVAAGALVYEKAVRTGNYLGLNFTE